MKKIAMTVATATILLGGFAGCGTDNQETGMNAQNNRTGIHSQDMGATGTTGRHHGEGPITDMMTPDRGHRGGFGTTNHNQNFGGQGERGTYGTSRAQGHTNYHGTLDNQQRGGGYGLNAGEGQGRTHLNNYHTLGDERGFFGTQEGRTPGMGRTGLNEGRMGAQATQGGFGARGITGNDRPGMVDEDGVLRERGGNRVGMQNRHQSNQRQGMGALNLNPRHKQERSRAVGMENSATRGYRDALNNEFGVETGVNRQDRQQTTRATENNQGQKANYHRSYDSQTVEKINKELRGIKGLNDSRVIVHDDDIVVGVQAERNSDDVRDRVEDRVNDIADGKNVRVVSDSDAFGRIRTMDDELRGGAAFEEVGATFEDMLRDLGNAVQRPFERSR
ncbi:YhcN/YlaJ family sporulation lipoprotein [Halalkalibacter sp. APA_J-10(15)]|uniref:YhcN/YlaJ family sporulation lipoprotein n=1 Tax=unclassified Halalkalibacter TaxID=2893063 RepID=UPI001FF27953|nr:YhcN/YlaJ family sporulation lipoprotein [Halalkalibacter sp. APA_J-10(15)]MCK0471133.1 YhcN/YlaJ family sporulation lipoprotein [Halalkalibacter sp. APA_J-10(15)]